MKNLLTEYNETGICVLDVNKVCENWNDKFYISQYHNDYFFVKYGKGKSYCKVKISEEQAKEVIDKMNLLPIQSGMLVHAKSYKTREFIKSEIVRIGLIVKEKKDELNVIGEIFSAFVKAVS